MNTQSQEVSTASRASAPARAEYTLRPAVDVFENGDGLVCNRRGSVNAVLSATAMSK